MRTRFRKPLLYPLSYGGAGDRVTSALDSLFVRTNWFTAAIVLGVAAIVIAAIAMRLS